MSYNDIWCSSLKELKMKFKKGMSGAGKFSSPIFSLRLFYTQFILRCYSVSHAISIVIIQIGSEASFVLIARWRKFCMCDKRSSRCLDEFNNEATNLKHEVNIWKILRDRNSIYFKCTTQDYQLRRTPILVRRGKCSFPETHLHHCCPENKISLSSIMLNNPCLFLTLDKYRKAFIFLKDSERTFHGSWMWNVAIMHLSYPRSNKFCGRLGI